MKEILKSLRHKKFVGVAELSAQVAAILENSDTSQEKATVTEYPDERTIRYYLTEGLMPPSVEKQGTASVFGYEHLLALLSIKKLQAQNLPIKKIREILAGKNTGELEQLLGVVGEDISDKNEAQKYLESLLLPQASKSKEIEPPQFLQKINPPNSAKQGTQPASSQSWKRYEVEKGLEIHIERTFKAPSDAHERRTLLQMIEEIIQSWRTK